MATRRKIRHGLRQQVRARAQHRCEYCRSPEDFSLDSFAVDHIQPVAQTGDDSLENLAFACPNCNNRKQDDRVAVDPQTGNQVPLYHPRQDRWSDHFRWSEDALIIVPLTAAGRATVARRDAVPRRIVRLISPRRSATIRLRPTAPVPRQSAHHYWDSTVLNRVE